MSRDVAQEATLLELITQLRLMSANSVMYSQATAEKAGLHSTDMECIDHLLLHGPMTAGNLSELTGLATGTMTAVIDRLERAGYVRRERGERDRRQVLVVPNEEKVNAELAPITRSLGMAAYAQMQRYTESELQVVLRFLRESNALALREITALRRKDEAGSGGAYATPHEQQAHALKKQRAKREEE